MDLEADEFERVITCQYKSKFSFPYQPTTYSNTLKQLKGVLSNFTTLSCVNVLFSLYRGNFRIWRTTCNVPQLQSQNFIAFHHFTIILMSLNGSFKKSAVIRTANYQPELSSNCDRVQTNPTRATTKVIALCEFSNLSAGPVHGAVAFRLMVTKLWFPANIRNNTFFFVTGL